MGREKRATRAALVTLAIVAIAIAAVVVAGAARPSGFRAWLAEARDGDDDWGWELLDSEAQAAYGGDSETYVADMAAVEWGDLEFGPAVDLWTDDGFAHVRADLHSPPGTVPAFLLERQIVHGLCDGMHPSGIGVFEDRRPFKGHRFGGGGLTGGQRRCNVAFSAAGE